MPYNVTEMFSNNHTWRESESYQEHVLTKLLLVATFSRLAKGITVPKVVPTCNTLRSLLVNTHIGSSVRVNFCFSGLARCLYSPYSVMYGAARGVSGRVVFVVGINPVLRMIDFAVRYVANIVGVEVRVRGISSMSPGYSSWASFTGVVIICV
uniref:WS_DGAT_C domain-containing protein n=1 Tax=Heterorhabditis bacteriophora TaxID=37862 RepID=A0A1I7WEF6_HETBA